MASLVGAKSALTPRGIPGLVGWRATASTTYPRSYTVTFSQLRPGGISGRRYGSFAKTVSTLVALTASDTASLSATEDPIDRNEIATTDTARLSATESSALFNFIAATDTATLSVSETISLVQSGVTLKTASDTASLSASETTAVSVTVEVSDTASISASDSATVDVSTEQKTATDTASLTTDEAVLLNVFTGENVVNVTDTATLRVVESATAIELRRIRRIALSITQPRIELEIL